MMTLGELISILEQLDPSKVVPRGFTNPHSYRGYYDQLAFEPARDVTIEHMLLEAKEALGSVYHGYKGGEYMMYEDTPVNLAVYGSTGDPMDDTFVGMLLRTMV